MAKKDDTVLLVDDDESVRSIVQEMLERAEYTVLTAASGREAIALFRKHQTCIICAVIDVVMPEMDGIETLRALRGMDPTLHAVLVSGNPGVMGAKSRPQDLPCAFLPKPYTLSQLLAEFPRAAKDTPPA